MQVTRSDCSAHLVITFEWIICVFALKSKKINTFHQLSKLYWGEWTRAIGKRERIISEWLVGRDSSS